MIDKKHAQRQQDEITAITDHCKKVNEDVDIIIQQYHALSNRFLKAESFEDAIKIYEELQHFIVANID